MPELVWKGKQALRDSEAAHRCGARSLRTDETYGGFDQDGGGGRLIRGAGVEVLSALRKELRGRVSLVYIDPPFDSGAVYDYLVSIAPVSGDRTEPARVRIPAFRDLLGLDGWLDMFFETARLVRELLREGGSLYVHLDAHAVHYAKVVLDEVFGSKAFQRDIVWRIGWVSGFKSRAKNWIRNHDTILYYVKPGAAPVFNKEYVPYPSDYARRRGAQSPGPGYPIEDVWNANRADRLDSIQIKSFSGEKVGYPTQKNESLVARIVRTSSDPGDIVLDCFGGSGTTAVAAHRLGRRWILCDSSALAIHATRKRLLTESPAPPFSVESFSDAPPDHEPGSIVIRAKVDDAADRNRERRYSVDIVVEGFDVANSAAAAAARSRVSHFSQWIDGWCVDWDSRGEALRAGTSIWRTRSGLLALRASHEYACAGSVIVRVRIFDVCGGVTTRDVAIDVRT